MKRKTIFLGIICLFFFSCASMQVKKEETSYFDQFEFDEVWGAALMAISDVGFAIMETEKASGIIYAQGGKNPISMNRPPQLNVFIKKLNGKISVYCKAIQPGQLVDWGAGKKHIKKFFKALNKHLGK